MDEKKDNALSSLLKRLGSVDFEALKKKESDEEEVSEEQGSHPPFHPPTMKNAEETQEKTVQEEVPPPPSIGEESPRQTPEVVPLSDILKRLKTNFPEIQPLPQQPPVPTEPSASPLPREKMEAVSPAVRQSIPSQIPLPPETPTNARLVGAPRSATVPRERPDDKELEKDLAILSSLYLKMGTKIGEFVVGHRPLIHLLSVAMIAEGHILIEGAPGTAKTVIAKAMAHLSGCTFRRIQSVGDLQPADILGIRVYDPKKKDFLIKEGPIFSNFLFIDEINRLPPKTQSAFIEAMSEEQVTIDGITCELSRPFFVIATQNPYELEGTFPLIETQKDRFMFSTRLTHLSWEEEVRLTERADAGILDWAEYYRRLLPLADADLLSCCSATARRVYIEKPLLEYIADLVVTTRSHPDVRVGASARASIALVKAGKAVAALDNRPYVTPKDIRHLAPAVLQHRLILKRETENRGITTEQVIQEILDMVEVP
jgi:MoxR-like ATPase